MQNERLPDEELQKEELRIALVMNGGVSLAIWMQGATNEIGLLRRGKGCYGELLQMMQSEVRVDVISGTSAGGINGAALSASMVYGTEFSVVRDLWINDGAFSDLLRHPLDGDAPSLLRGDEYLHEKLLEAFHKLTDGSDIASPREAPLDLTLTTTLLEGSVGHFVDDLGAVITDTTHRGRLRFRRDQDRDDFADESVVQKLALAARCTASFPVAFEPSYVPLTDADARPNRPNMKGIAEKFTESGYVVDGGVLDNKPFGPAINAIFNQRGERVEIRGVRRVLAYIVPDPVVRDHEREKSNVPQGEDTRQDDMPPLAQVAINSLLKLPQAESIQDELRRIRRRNRRAKSRRRARLSITDSYDYTEIDLLSKALFPFYRNRRLDQSLEYIVEEIAAAPTAAEEDDPGPSQEQAGEVHLSLGQRVRTQCFAKLLNDTDKDKIPWLPQDFGSAFGAGAAEDTWRWGMRPIEHAALMLLDLLRMAEQACVATHTDLPMAGFWTEAQKIINDARALRQQGRKFWANCRPPIPRAGQSLPPEGSIVEWFQQQLARWKELRPEGDLEMIDAADTEMNLRSAAGRLARRVAKVLIDLDDVRRQLAEQVGDYRKEAEQEEAAAQDQLRLSFFERFQRQLGYFLRPDEPHSPPIEAVVSRLLRFEILDELLVHARPNEIEQTVELVQISGNTGSPLGGPSRAAAKLAGVQLAHFGAFYKKSWRANDWMYGRLDGSERLIHIVLNPERLLVVAEQRDDKSKSQWALDRIREIAVQWEGVDDATKKEWDDALPQIKRELAFLDDPEKVIPDSLPECANAIIRRIHLEILLDELPRVKRAVQHDLDHGTRNDGGAANFSREFEQQAEFNADAAITLFQRYEVGKETLVQELGTDYCTKILSQTLAVTATAGHSSKSGFGWASALFQAVRAPFLIFYLIARNAGMSHTTMAFTNGALSVFGITVLVIHFFTGASLPGFLLAVAWACAIAAVLAGLTRDPLRRRLVIAVLIAFAVFLVGWQVWRAAQDKGLDPNQLDSKSIAILPATASRDLSDDLTNAKTALNQWRTTAAAFIVATALLVFGSLRLGFKLADGKWMNRIAKTAARSSVLVAFLAGVALLTVPAYSDPFVPAPVEELRHLFAALLIVCALLLVSVQFRTIGTIATSMVGAALLALCLATGDKHWGLAVGAGLLLLAIWFTETIRHSKSKSDLIPNAGSRRKRSDR